MADDVIFIRRGEDLVPLAVTPYEAEDVLQDLLEHHPQLLAGYQMDRSDPRRFLLVSWEAPVTDSDGGSWRWSIDHLFVDQDAIPTLVEVKRSSDTRIRRLTRRNSCLLARRGGNQQVTQIGDRFRGGEQARGIQPIIVGHQDQRAPSHHQTLAHALRCRRPLRHRKTALWVTGRPDFSEYASTVC